MSRNITADFAIQMTAALKKTGPNDLINPNTNSAENTITDSEAIQMLCSVEKNDGVVSDSAKIVAKHYINQLTELEDSGAIGEDACDMLIAFLKTDYEL